MSGPGSQAERRRLLTGLFAGTTDPEREFLVRLLAGDLRQGALEGIMTDAVARAAAVPAEEVRRAHQLGGSLPEVALAALGGTPRTADRALAALRAITLRVGRPARPMLAASAPDVATALGRISPAAAEWKIDGIRVQVHRSGDQVAVFTRTLDDITARVPEIVAATRSLPVTAAVLDGEAVALAADGRPRPFQVTAARTASQGDAGRLRDQTPLTLVPVRSAAPGRHRPDRRARPRAARQAGRDRAGRPARPAHRHRGPGGGRGVLRRRDRPRPGGASC